MRAFDAAALACLLPPLLVVLLHAGQPQVGLGVHPAGQPCETCHVAGPDTTPENAAASSFHVRIAMSNVPSAPRTR